MATPKTSQLANLAQQFPSMAAQGQQIQQSSAALAAAEAVRKQAATGQRVSASDMGAQLYTAQAAAAREAQQKVQKGAMQVGQLELQQQAMQKQQILADRQLGQQQQVRKNEQILTELSGDIKTKLYDKAMKFNKDELGRTQWQTSQLMDYQLRKSQRWQDYRQMETKVGQMQKRRMTVLKTAQAQIQQAMQQEFAKSEAVADRELQARLTKVKAEIDERIRKAQAEAAEQAAAWTTGGQIIGTVLGAAAGMAITAATAGVGAAAIAKGGMLGANIGGSLGAGIGGLAKPKANIYQPSREEVRGMIRRR